MSSRPVWHRLAATVGFAILPAYAQSASNVQRAGGHAPADLNAPQALPPLKAQEHANYDVAVDALSPLTESQIRALRRRLDRAKRGAAVTFIDRTGAPWDIIEVNNMAPQRFEVLKPVPSVPTMTITAQGDYVEGDVAVFLKDLPYPVVIKMVAGQRETDYRLDLRIPKTGPNAQPAITTETAIGLPSATLQSPLEGIEPPQAKPIRIRNAPANMKAWLIGNAPASRIVLRTSLFLNNPAYYGSLTSADGTHVYEIPQ